MKELKVRLIEAIKRTVSVVSFRFALPEKVEFIPGQFLQIIFDGENRGNKDLNKYLSLSCSPARGYIEITKRISKSNFSEHLLSLKPNDEVLVKIPLGSCIFKDEYKRVGFLIGGIGITPVISIIEHIIDMKLDTELFLFYSNRNEDDIAFKKELDHWQAINKKIKIFYTVTERLAKDKTCLFGQIDRKLLEEKARNLAETILYIFGPPKMVEAMANLAMETACKKENIKTEKFIGY